ncbi:hypothetical protein C2R22_06040 [Salinigranum rubrum]|uniref:Uncharacterized protein n=1 Tax=Salinigranum rubrum TaxID=755307 RepID=A0A2I8VJP1_9EURY|nr:hypothetical protein [Salinigranum rubrum]AUV81279.1 hypothetical protein C2R22_06040 [Salinigranum rubrum]
MVSPTIVAALIGASVTLVLAVGGWGVRTVTREIRESRDERREEHQEVWSAVVVNYNLTKEIAAKEGIDVELPEHPLESRDFDNTDEE